MNGKQLNVLCLASYFKGNDFIRECKRRGACVTLITREKMLQEEWVRDSLDSISTVPDRAEIEDYLHAAAEVSRAQKPQIVVALEEADVITAARIREYLCLQGISSKTARCFRDKLAMRVRAREAKITQPEFVHLLNYQEVGEYMGRVPSPWVLKPRADSSSIGIHRFDEAEEVWREIDRLNANESRRERAPAFMIERFVSGSVFHVNSLVNNGEVVFADVSQYAIPPLVVTQHGGVSVSHSIDHKSEEQRALLEANVRVISALGLSHGTTHAEFIKSDLDGEFYFLEAGARVGGAHTSETVEAARGVNLWREWAAIELSQVRSKPNFSPSRNGYALPPTRREFSGIAVSLARQEHPDTSLYNDPEIVFRVSRPFHVGLVVRSPALDRVLYLLDGYVRRFSEDFTAVAPQQDRVE